jgi:hypothetical protein
MERLKAVKHIRDCRNSLFNSSSMNPVYSLGQYPLTQDLRMVMTASLTFPATSVLTGVLISATIFDLDGR